MFYPLCLFHTEKTSNQSTFGAAIGYSSGKNSSNLKTPPEQIFQTNEYTTLNVQINSKQRKRKNKGVTRKRKPSKPVIHFYN